MVITVLCLSIMAKLEDVARAENMIKTLLITTSKKSHCFGCLLSNNPNPNQLSGFGHPLP
jgi:hypothetical protein